MQVMYSVLIRFPLDYPSRQIIPVNLYESTDQLLYLPANACAEVY